MAFVGELKEFQQEAFERMLQRKKLLVGYEMGLGKTVITIAAVEALLERGVVGTCLVIVPSSLKFQWKRQIDAFTGGDGISLVVDGDLKARKRQYAEIRGGWIEYAILNYEQVVNDWEIVRHLPRDCVVLDEATAIKNPGAKRSRRIKRLLAPYRFALTGQPVENRPEEAFSILQWVDSDVLGRFDVFDRTFVARNPWGKVQYYKNLPLLHETIAEAMVRKTRQDPDVRDQMPRVGTEVIHVPFERPGAALYNRIVDDLLGEVAAAKGKFGSFDLFSHYHGISSEEAAARGRIMSRMTCLRMLCDHPHLLRVSAMRYAKANGEDHDDDVAGGIAGGSIYAKQLFDEGLLDDLPDSPKMGDTVALIKEILDANPLNKIVVFAFFKDMLKMLQQETVRVTDSVLFTGDMNAKQKDTAKQQFADDPRTRLFLSSDAGGYGVDLPNANYLISYDLPWSAGKLDQRNARIIRLSSEFEAVTLIYMLMEESIEVWMLQMLEKKGAIGSAVVDGKGIDSKGRLEMDVAGLAEFLRASQV